MKVYILTTPENNIIAVSQNESVAVSIAKKHTEIQNEDITVTEFDTTPFDEFNYDEESYVLELNDSGDVIGVMLIPFSAPLLKEECGIVRSHMDGKDKYTVFMKTDMGKESAMSRAVVAFEQLQAETEDN